MAPSSMNSSLLDEWLPPQQTAPSSMNSSPPLEEQLPPSLVDEWHPLVGERLPPLKNGSLPRRMVSSLIDERCPPSLVDEWRPPSLDKQCPWERMHHTCGFNT